jgi:predicted transcriptional regulator
MPRVVQLRKERLGLRDEMRSLAGTIEAAQDQYPELYWKHDEVCKKLEKVRRTLRQEAKQKMREEYYDTMPINEVDKQIDQLVDNPDADLSDS